jgi:hydrogenase maturation protein HypF
MSGRVRRDVRVEGVVEGVGFRPFVYSLAIRLGLAGRVGTDINGVFIEVEGPSADVDDFLAALERDAPRLAEIERVTTVATEPRGAAEFTIVESDVHGFVSPDSATCDDCLRELADPADRRFGYPFINCANCGPRFTSTLTGFDRCEACAAEYQDSAGRRCHAQATCCPDCGPRLRLVDQAGDPVTESAALLRDGKVVAVKGIGGYHLAVLASDEKAVGALRARKHSADKPFAVMVPTVDSARELCEVDDAAGGLLTDRRGPIVVLPRLLDATVAPSVAPGNRHLGLMLPDTPLHHLLLAAVGAPIVLTSGNRSGEPIAHVDTEAFAQLAGIADAFLTHDRPIPVRIEHSVVRKDSVVRRSLGYVPEPITLRWHSPRPILACGAELNGTFCLARERHAFVSQHLGDLANGDAFKSFVDGIEHFQRLHGIIPAVVAHDLHPGYRSTKHAKELTGVELVGVQHHHAHIASCLADNGEPGPVIGVVFDGLDDTGWGGEFLVADLVDFERVGHLVPIPMPGGAAAAKEPWRMAAAYLDEAYDGDPPKGLDVLNRNDSHWHDGHSPDSPVTSSAGGLFDAVSAMLGLRDTINYAGQAAMELEQLADPHERGEYLAVISGNGPLLISGSDLVRAAAEDLLAGVEPSVIAARFHNGVIDVIVRCCAELRDTTEISTVALSGDLFQNVLLRHGVAEGLRGNEFRVLTHSRVPTDDGGISLGQAAVAAARDRR